MDLIRDSLVFEAFFVWLVDAGFMGDLARGVRNRFKVKWARFKLRRQTGVRPEIIEQSGGVEP